MNLRFKLGIALLLLNLFLVFGQAISQLVSKKIYNQDKSLLCDGYFKNNKLVNGTKYFYDQDGILLHIVKYANSEPLELSNLSISRQSFINTYYKYLGLDPNHDFSIDQYLLNNKLKNGIVVPNYIDSSGRMQGLWTICENNQDKLQCQFDEARLLLTRKNVEFSNLYDIEIIDHCKQDSCISYIDFYRMKCEILSPIHFNHVCDNSGLEFCSQTNFLEFDH